MTIEEEKERGKIAGMGAGDGWHDAEWLANITRTDRVAKL
jgi:hypothetical protein